jgi:hypothetical protein
MVVLVLDLDWFSTGFLDLVFFGLSLDIVERSTLFKILFDVSFPTPFN